MRCLLFTVFCFSFFGAFAQGVKLKGIVLDNEGQPLPSASVKILSEDRAIVTDLHGGFTFSTTKEKVILEISHLGNKTLKQSFLVKNDTLIHFNLEPEVNELSEVEVTSNRILQSDQFETTRMSTYSLGEEEIKSIPALFGEADLLKVIQLLPGTTKGFEGSTDLFVRGGAADQNLVLLDGAPVYNTGHLFGFLSVFNSDVLQEVEYTSGAFPAQSGGRLSSILNVNTVSTMASRTQVKGNIGLLASRLMIRQPLIKNKLDIWVAGRRTYVDQVVKILGQRLPYYFYDFNAKIIFHPTPRDVVEVGHYSGSDILSYKRQRSDTARWRLTSNFTIDNSAQTFLWKRQLAPDIHSTLNLYRTKFNYSINNAFGENKLGANSAILDYGGKFSVRFDSTERFSWTTGIESVYHQVSPSVISTEGDIAEVFESTTAFAKTSLESSAFIQFDGTMGRKWRWSAGLRYSSAYVDEQLYTNPEPRLAIRYEVNHSLALKASYSRMSQYLHRVSSSAMAFPTDIWYPVTKNVEPQLSDQVNLALQQKLPGKNLFITLEGYYKEMQNLVGYREGTNLFLNNDFEQELIQGRGRAYGLELLVKKESGRFTGWISYTLSKSTRQYDEVNNGDWFNSRYDRRHNGSIVMSYELTKRLSISAVFEFISGSRFTPIIGQYAVPVTTQVGVELIPVYAPMNSVKLADTHRLDLGLKYRSRPGRRFQSEWFLGVYNTYNRATPYGIIIEQTDEGTFRYAQPGLFGMLPSFGYGFKF